MSTESYKIYNKVACFKFRFNGSQCIQGARGFTLIEIIVAVAIIGILSSFLMANFLGARERARDATRKSDLAQIQSALEFFRSDHGYYPPSADTTDPTKNRLSGNTECGIGVPFEGITTTTQYLKNIPCSPATGGAKATEPYIYVASSCDSTDSFKCYAYTLTATLENVNDSQAILVSGVPKFTVTNP